MIPVYALNIAANPHPPGTYIRLLSRASQVVVKAHGSDYATISAPQPSPDAAGVYVGRILVWTEINLRGRWYDRESNNELSDDLRSQINIPPNAKPNFKWFSYAFKEHGHRFYFESRNEFGENVGPTTVRRVMSQLVAQDIQGFSAPEVSVTLVPNTGAVNAILALPGLRTLTMRVVLPNPDETDPEAVRRVRDRLRAAHAGQLDETYRKAANEDRLLPTQEIQETAAVAAENGFVRGEGSADGRKVSLATNDQPRRELVPDNAGTNFLSRLLGSVGLF
jgi:hypothetical protein